VFSSFLGGTVGSVRATKAGKHIDSRSGHAEDLKNGTRKLPSLVDG